MTMLCNPVTYVFNIRAHIAGMGTFPPRVASGDSKMTRLCTNILRELGFYFLETPLN